MDMALMLISHVVAQKYLIAGTILWVIACMAHIVFMCCFFYYRLRDPDFNHILPSWYVPPIGIVVASLAVPLSVLHPVGVVFVVFGLICYLLMLPIVLYRLIIGSYVEPDRQPTLAVLAAPPSLILAGYLTVVQNPNPFFVISLLSIAILMTIIVYLLLFQLLKLPFSASFSALTFPLVISAVATHKVTVCLPTLFERSHLYWLSCFSTVEAVIALVIVIYVTYHYFCFFWARQFNW